MHPIGKEKPQPIRPTPQTWVGDLPSDDPTDWFESVEEYYEAIGYNPDNEDDELLEDEWLIDEY